MIDYPFITEFLRIVEGGPVTQGYIPCYKKSGGTFNYKGQGNPNDYIAMGASGVTIATGFDLGQYKLESLLNWGMPHDLATIYAPYLGKKKEQAISLLHDKPLSVSSQLALQTECIIISGYVNDLITPFYNKNSTLSFVTLPKHAQAAITSLCYHLGCYGAKNKAPITFKWLTQGEWKKAAHELINGFRNYAGRRAKEGRLLLEIA